MSPYYPRFAQQLIQPLRQRRPRGLLAKITNVCLLAREMAGGLGEQHKPVRRRARTLKAMPRFQTQENKDDRFGNNVRRLLLFHHKSAKEAADALGVAQHTVSAWITGKRKPSGNYLLRIAQNYDFDPRILADARTADFAAELARPERIDWVEERLAKLVAQRLGIAVSDEDRERYRLDEYSGPTLLAPQTGEDSEVRETK